MNNVSKDELSISEQYVNKSGQAFTTLMFEDFNNYVFKQNAVSDDSASCFAVYVYDKAMHNAISKIKWQMLKIVKHFAPWYPGFVECYPWLMESSICKELEDPMCPVPPYFM